MTDRMRQALHRLREVASKADSEGRGMEISEIVEAVAGTDVDDELEEMVSLAMESAESGMDLEEMAKGVVKLLDWRNRNT